MEQKGQHTILREVFLFAIGVAITSFIVLSFNSVQSTSRQLAMSDQMLKVATVVGGTVVHMAEIGENATIRVALPEKLSDEIYRIKLSDGVVHVSLFSDPSINVTKKIFNIEKTYVISGEVISTGRFFEIVFEDSSIRIRRAVV